MVTGRRPRRAARIQRGGQLTGPADFAQALKFVRVVDKD